MGITNAQPGKYLDLPGRPHVQVFEITNGQLLMGEKLFTSVVIDRDGFELLLNDLVGNPPSGIGGEQWNEAIAKFRYLGNIPIIGRGAKTEWLFTRFEATTKIMGIIVRGEADDVVLKMGLDHLAQS